MFPRVFPWICFLAAVSAAQPATTRAVPVEKEPVHRLVFENEYVRAFQVEVPMGAATLLHHHDKDYIVVTLGDSEVSNQREGGTPAVLKFKDGDTLFVRSGFAHVARNLVDKPYRNVTVEILQPMGTFVCGAGSRSCTGGSIETDGLVWSDVAKSDVVQVRQFVVAPQGIIAKHEHKGPHLVIAITNLLLRSDIEGKPPMEIIQSAGDIKWIRGGFTHSVTNVGAETVRFVSIEFK